MNPFLQPICNFANFFSTPLITAIAFIVCALLLITVAMTEVKGVVGHLLRIAAAIAGLLALKSLITTVWGVSFGC
ncbi:hypothetical protein ABEG10_38070 (plasmid) [Burkholderia cenocepacia]|uniref:hypothetical protein n=1 Tax=Burkholderia cepacia complex TaxID=87882 RepID=UPI001CF1E7B5|nr:MULTISPECIES: hypothetical protein [Burkholderia cepacia complex]MCA8355577.1 hypothetical protein [Burkholderia cepacia]MCO8402805.1 hypothetical protein [Burkholderia cenocepacia]MCO8415044.1 hypothetical protein [Burkholderia cenocepacia]MCO8423060.1 hypothetical protein [Burkholderia cenocepacia]MCO8474791.1 hypothetical protein [Burkholderia cenocepacia]